MSVTSATVSSPGGSSGFVPTSELFAPKYRVTWRVLMRAPNGLPQWLSIRAPSEGQALDELAKIRPEWDVVKIERERSP